MDIPTIPGAWYTVATATTCEITDTATGTPLGTANAGSYSFQAQGNLTTLSDDSALYSKSNFKSAPAALMALGLLGGGSSTPALPAGYLVAEFLKNTGQQNFRLPDFNLSEITESEVDFYVDYLNGTSYGAVFSLYNDNHSTRVIPEQASKLWRFYFNAPALKPSLTLPYNGDGLGHKALKMNNSVVEWQGSSYPINTDMSGNTVVPLGLFTGNVASVNNFSGNHYRLYSLKIKTNDVLSLSIVPCLTSLGLPCFFDSVTGQTFLATGADPTVGLTLAQARNLSKLPSTGGTLTISLPTGYDSDSGVMNALDTARANGWTLTIQTYTPEAEASSTTFALRRIWVRRMQSEYGAYVAADGTRWHVEWCVDMLTPDGSTPDAYGYELFRSQEAAVAYWELTPYVDPESENLLTE